MGRRTLALIVAVLAAAFAAAPAQAKNESVGVFKTNGDWRLIDRLARGADPADYAFPYGTSGDVPVAGDWNATGGDGVGVFRSGYFGSWWLTNQAVNGGAPPSDIVVTNFGQPGDRPFAGDFNGDGKDDIGYYRPSTATWKINISPVNGEDNPAPEITITGWGISSDLPIAGDWDGDGKDGIGVYRPAAANGAWFLLNNPTNGANNPPSDVIVATYGTTGDQPVAGDWDGDGKDGIGVYRSSNASWWFVNDVSASVTSPPSNILFSGLGASTDKPVAGDWDAKKPQCRDGLDNDQDDQVDHPSDVGCAAAYDTPEDAPPSTPLGTFEDDFETSPFPGSEWSDVTGDQVPDKIIQPTASDGAYERVTSSEVPPAHGSWSVRSELYSTGSRSEIQCHRPQYFCAGGEGTEFMYDLDFRIPSGYDPGRPAVLTQSKPTAPNGLRDCYGGGFLFDQSATDSTKITLSLAVEYGDVFTNSSGFCDSPEHLHGSLGTFAKNAWHRIRYWVRWSVNPGIGFVEVWVDGQKVLPRTYEATILNGTGRIMMFRIGMYETLNPTNYHLNYKAYYDNVVITQLQ